MSPQLSSRVLRMEGSATGRAGTSRSSTTPAIDLATGCPDWAPPAAALAAARAALNGHVPYGAPGGNPALRERLLQRCPLSSSSRRRQVVITSGGKEGLFLGLGAVLSPGDRVTVLAPYWPSFLEQIRAFGAEPIVVSADADGLPDATSLRVALAASKAVIVNSPCNPSGATWDAQRFAELARLAEECDVWVLLDAVYAELRAPDSASPLESLPASLVNRTLLVDSGSKSFALPGLRIGWASGPTRWIDAVRKLQDACSTHPSTSGQAALSAALDAAPGWLPAVQRELELRRARIRVEIDQSESLSCRAPSAGLFALVKIPSECCDQRLAARLAASFGVRVMPGSDFGAPGTLRLALRTSPDRLGDAIHIVENALRAEV